MSATTETSVVENVTSKEPTNVSKKKNKPHFAFTVQNPVARLPSSAREFFPVTIKCLLLKYNVILFIIIYILFPNNIIYFNIFCLL